MELWIRSQDKLVLSKVGKLIVNGYDIFNQDQVIGTYSTYERALEVLGEIHNHLEKLFWFNPKIEEDRRLNQLIKSCVYNMPKE